jgi:hypothetical protein
MWAGAQIDPTSDQNYTAARGLVSYQAGNRTNGGSTGVVTGSVGFEALNGQEAGATITNQYGVYVNALTVGDNNYSLWIDTPTGTIADAIHVVGGRTYLGGSVEFAGYTRHYDLSIGAAVLGAAAVTFATIETFRCAVFDAQADLAFLNFEVPDDWDGASNMALNLEFFTETGDALGNGEIIEFHAEYRSIAEGEAYDNGSSVTITPTVTGGASETAKGFYEISASIAYTGGNQPLAVDDILGIKLLRDVDDTDTYTGDVMLCKAELEYTSDTLAAH